jgi:hypothetical protein
MDSAIVERAVRALAAIGAAKQTVPESSPIASQAQDVKGPEREGLALCGSPACGGCYEVAPGVRIHPRKSGMGWVQ